MHVKQRCSISAAAAMIVVAAVGCSHERDRAASHDLAGSLAGDGGTQCGDTTYLVSYDPGADGVWGTDDDVVSQRMTQRFIDNRMPSSVASYSGAGADGVWGTADDVMAGWSSSSVDSEGRFTGNSYAAPGSDGVWFTMDDVMSARVVEQGYDGVAFTAGTEFQAPGPDGTWATADDAITDRWTDKPHEGGYEELHYQPGPDGLWNTADDAAAARADFAQKPDGTFVVTYYVDPGADQVWGTSDDTVGAMSVMQCDRGAATGYDGPGADGVWGTNDDHVSSHTVLSAGFPCANLCTSIIY